MAVTGPAGSNKAILHYKSPETYVWNSNQVRKTGRPFLQITSGPQKLASLTVGAVLIAKYPMLITENPALTAKKPALITKNPALITKNPAFTAKKPAPITQNPAPGNPVQPSLLRPLGFKDHREASGSKK